MKLKQIFIWSIAPLLIGSLFSFGLAPFKFWPATFASIALWYLLLEKFPQYGKRISFFFGYGYFIFGTSWIYFAFITVNIPAPVAAASILSFCAGFSMLFFFQGWAYLRFMQNKSYKILSFALIWMLFEWLRSWLFTGFPWLYAGYSLTDTPIAQISSIVSVYGISFLVALFSILFLEILKFNTTKKLIIVSSFISLFFIGFVCQKINFSTQIGEINAAAVQSNVDQKIKWTTQGTRQSRDFFFDQSFQLTETDLIVWPEAALTDHYENNDRVIEYIDQWGKQNNTAIITGTPLLIDGKPRNSMAATGNASGTYDKMHLVPFGEYMPYGDFIRKALPFLSLNDFDYYKGEKNQPAIVLNQIQEYETKEYQISSVICYEAAYPDLVRQNSIGKSLIVTVSNDDWFGRTFAPHQHLQIAQMRAIENRLSVVRSTQSGLTAFIDPYGKVTHQLEPFVPATLVGKVSMNESKTFYQTFGHTYIMVISILVLVGLYFRKVK